MAQLELTALDPACIQELASGHRLKVVIDSLTVAEIIPTDAKAIQKQQSTREAPHAADVEKLLAMMEKGSDLGGVWKGRDELYDRD